MSGTCSPHGGKNKPEGKKTVEGPSNTLENNIKTDIDKYGLRLQTEFIWLRVGSSCEIS
jgi:hypothetical protein